MWTVTLERDLVIIPCRKRDREVGVFLAVDEKVSTTRGILPPSLVANSARDTL